MTDPRTKHINSDGSPIYTNRLSLESSPYLQQHAHNPVNWFPWGDEAFQLAANLKRPIFLSIGYSTCHWCHVMEEESFEDVELAKYLNANYISIKVDREERPDIDLLYMEAVQAMTGSGGWPMSVWLTYDRKPFYGGTYFPARDGDRGSHTGFLTLLEKLHEVYQASPEKIKAHADELVTYISSSLTKSDTSETLPTMPMLHKAFSNAASRFDSLNGGVLGAPKFPSSLPIRFFLRYYHRTKNEAALNMATLTLHKMATSGLYDRVAGGFHRYSTDKIWLVPHFEKMLYDNALLAVSYLEGYQVTGDQSFLRVVNEVLRYIERDMTSPEGAFYSATDADSLTPDGEREEGYFFTWTPDELQEILGKETAEIVKDYFAVTDDGNFEGRNIFYTPHDLRVVAEKFHLSSEELLGKIDEAKELLYQARLSRPQPLRDEKILTSWNSLMISAYARSGFVLENTSYVKKAVRAAEFVKEKLFKNGRLYRTYKDGRSKYNAYLEDYAFYMASLLDLYEATHDFKWFKFALDLDVIVSQFYEDKDLGGFYMTSHDHEELLVRVKPSYDGAEPCGNSVMLLNLLRLYVFTTKINYLERSEKAFKLFFKDLTQRSSAVSEMLLALDFYLDKPKSILLLTSEGQKDEASIFLQELRKKFLPHKVLVVLSEGNEFIETSEEMPFVQGKKAIEGRATVYICEEGACKVPISEVAEFIQAL